MHANFHRKVQHGVLAWRDIGLFVVNCHLVGHEGVFLLDPQNCTVCHHAIQAVVGSAGGGDDHFTVAFGQIAGATDGFRHHQRVMVSKKRAPLGWATSKAKENMGNKPSFGLDFQDFATHVGW